MSIEHVGVVGAGVMGIGLAQNLAQTGHTVVLVDVSDEILAKSMQEIKHNIRFSRLFSKDKSAPQEPLDVVLGRIQATTDYHDLHDVDFLVENVVENWDVKKQVYETIDPICKPACVFAVNTSCISITRVGSVTNRADRIVGMHFMNPVPLKATAEVIRGYHTSDATIARAQEFLGGMGKSGVVVNDSPGFVSNRVLMLTVNEAAYLVYEGVSNAADVDKIFRECFGHAMGPLETADLIGLDTILFSIEVLHESYADSKYRPCPLLKKMVDAGLYGRKSGEGFFKYQTSMMPMPTP